MASKTWNLNFKLFINFQKEVEPDIKENFDNQRLTVYIKYLNLNLCRIFFI